MPVLDVTVLFLISCSSFVNRNGRYTEAWQALTEVLFRPSSVVLVHVMLPLTVICLVLLESSIRGEKKNHSYLPYPSKRIWFLKS